MTMPTTDDVARSRSQALGRRESFRWPPGNTANIKECNESLKSLGFDGMGMEDDDLLHLTLAMFTDVGAHERLGIETEKLQGFLVAVKDRMLENPFHNWLHVFHTTQACYAMMLKCNAQERLSDQQVNPNPKPQILWRSAHEYSAISGAGAWQSAAGIPRTLFWVCMMIYHVSAPVYGRAGADPPVLVHRALSPKP